MLLPEIEIWFPCGQIAHTKRTSDVIVALKTVSRANHWFWFYVGLQKEKYLCVVSVKVWLDVAPNARPLWKARWNYCTDRWILKDISIVVNACQFNYCATFCLYIASVVCSLQVLFHTNVDGKCYVTLIDFSINISNR